MPGGLRKGLVFGLGNPLLDMTTSIEETFLNKYQLKENSSTRIGGSAAMTEKQYDDMLMDIIGNFGVRYTAGGAVQNALRTFQWILGVQHKFCSTFMGCIGNDMFGKRLQKITAEEGIRTSYMINNETNTGSCVVLLSKDGLCRTLIAHLGAAQYFNKQYLDKHFELAKEAGIFYSSSYILGVSADSALCLAKYAFESKDKVFCINLGAPYVMTENKFSEPLLAIYPYCDYVFGNEDEAKAFAKLKKWKTNDTKEIAYKMANETEYLKKERWIIITQAERPVLVAKNDKKNVTEYPIPKIKRELIKDTNGAGDAFVGGFLAQLGQQKNFDICMRCAIYAATEIIQQIGLAFPAKCTFTE